MMNTNTRFPASTGPARRRRSLALLAAALLAATATAQTPSRTIEECLESGTDLVTLPGTAGGSLSASECRGCPSIRLSFDRNTRYFIGNEAVTYARLREAAARGDVRLDLFYQPTTRTLTRMRLAASGVAK